MTEEQRRADKYLSQIRNADREITDTINQINYLRYKASGATGIRYDKEHVQTSPEDMVCEAISEAVDLERHLSERNKELMRMSERTEEIISLWNNNNKYFIECYYLNRLSMVQTAERMHITDRHAYRIKYNALAKFAKHL